MKIYSVRVDAVHAEAYKVLGGINRAGQEDEQGNYDIELDMSCGLLYRYYDFTFFFPLK